jgi:putative membrane protein
VTLAEPAAAQSVGEKTGVNSALAITPKTTDFVAEVAASDMFELDRANLPWQRRKEGGAFAINWWATTRRHRARASRLTRRQTRRFPPDMSSAQQSMLQKLQGDRTGIREADDRVSAHKDAVSLFERYGKGDNAALRSWVTQSLPALQHHWIWPKS